MEKVWEIKDPEQYLKSQKRKPRVREHIEKSPAKAYTLSLVFWGVGQNYNEERGKGLLFQVSLIGLLVAVALSLFFNDALLQYLRAHRISPALAFLTTQLLFLSVLIFWFFVAGDAYHRAARSRKTRFPGIQSHVYPFLCSLVLPGWGQFLNGQPVKGSIFSGLSLFGLFSLATVPATLLAWPSLELSDERLIIEGIFAVTVLYAPLIPFIWLFGSYDALKVSLDDLKKESLWERIKSANNRRRTQGWIQGVFPQIRSTLLLGLALIVLAVVLPRSFLGYYRELLIRGKTGLEDLGMTLVPDIISRLVGFMARMSIG